MGVKGERIWFEHKELEVSAGHPGNRESGEKGWQGGRGALISFAWPMVGAYSAHVV